MFENVGKVWQRPTSKSALQFHYQNSLFVSQVHVL